MGKHIYFNLICLNDYVPEVLWFIQMKHYEYFMLSCFVEILCFAADLGYETLESVKLTLLTCFWSSTDDDGYI